MNRMAYWALPLLLICAVATLGIAQQAPAQQAQPEQPKWKDSKEYDDYMSVYNEKDFAKKAANAEKFFVDHKDADPIALTDVYRMMFLSYANSGNWVKALEAYDRINLGSKLSDGEKAQYLQVAMAAAVNSKNTKRTEELAEAVLKNDPNNFSALVTLSGLLSGSMPATNPAKDAHITKTLEITKRAIAVPKPKDLPDAQYNQVQQQLHDTACLMLLNQTKYAESMAECQAAIKINPKDAYAWYWIGLSHRAAFVDLNKKYVATVQEYNDHRSDPPLQLDEFRAAMQAADKLASDKLNETLDAFARAAAIGGEAGNQALTEMKKLFTGTPDELNKLIQEKKSLGN